MPILHDSQKCAETVTVGVWDWWQWMLTGNTSKKSVNNPAQLIKNEKNLWSHYLLPKGSYKNMAALHELLTTNNFCSSLELWLWCGKVVPSGADSLVLLTCSGRQGWLCVQHGCFLFSVYVVIFGVDGSELWSLVMTLAFTPIILSCLSSAECQCSCH